MQSKPYSECGIGQLPDKKILAGAMDSSWTIRENLPLTINWTTSLTSIKEKLINYVYGSSNKGIVLGENCFPTLINDKTTDAIANALEKWSVALGGKINFNHVPHLPDGKGIIFAAASASYNEFNKNGCAAFASHKKNGGKINHAVVVLPYDIFDSELNRDNFGFSDFIKEVILHEIGHALGINKHAHEIPALKKLIDLAENPDLCSIVDMNQMYRNSSFNKCTANGGKYFECHKTVNNSHPGEVDVAIFNARLQLEQEGVAKRKEAAISRASIKLEQEALVKPKEETLNEISVVSAKQKPSVLDGVASSFIMGASFGVAKASIENLLKISGASPRTSALVSGLSEAAWLLGTTALYTGGDMAKTAMVGGTIACEAMGYVPRGTSNNIAMGFGAGIASGDNSFTNSVLKTGASWVGKIIGEGVTNTLVSAAGMQR